jgi:hypothetical protein
MVNSSPVPWPSCQLRARETQLCSSSCQDARTTFPDAVGCRRQALDSFNFDQPGAMLSIVSGTFDPGLPLGDQRRHASHTRGDAFEVERHHDPIVMSVYRENRENSPFALVWRGRIPLILSRVEGFVASERCRSLSTMGECR